jgi:hypothetical protein
VQETESRLGEVKAELEVRRERESTQARERAELATQLADTQKAKANLECELESHFRSQFFQIYTQKAKANLECELESHFRSKFFQYTRRRPRLT